MSKRIVVVGSVNMDLVIPVGRFPEPGETVVGGDLIPVPGGKGANQACAAAKLNGRVSLIAQLGSDPFADTLRASIAGCGVDTTYTTNAPGVTGCASIYVRSDGENSIVISPGANDKLTPDDAVERLDAIGDVAILLLQLETPFDTVSACLQWAENHGAISILDPVPAREFPIDLLRRVTLLTPNQSEAAILLGTPSRKIVSFGNAELAAADLLALGPSRVVIKLGDLGCLIADAKSQIRVPAFRVEAVDTTAAGDCFNGALAVAIAEGYSMVDAATFANAAAALSVTRAGAQPSLPFRAEVEGLLISRNSLQSHGPDDVCRPVHSSWHAWRPS